MGVTLPTSGPVCIDASVAIYTVEKHPRYGPALRPLWAAADTGTAHVFFSELLLLETLVGPLKSGDARLAQDYESFFALPAIQLLPISQAILREAARLRATSPRLRSPDAIHAATALVHGAGFFVTNDAAFRSVPGIDVVLLDDLPL